MIMTQEWQQQKAQMQRAMHPDKGVYYYCKSLMPYKGQLIVLGKFFTEDEAYREGVKSIPIPFEVVSLNTPDMKKAKDFCKAKYLQDTQDLDGAIARTRHTMGGNDVDNS